ncbi:hypothetical protein DSO57_1000062 [Entomophthora muscae]|uniref:Uncharacterized protein n=1 Tax=Entomophthora muscae TaxID=34485 RepID=A0ACC2SMA3_9FUNG|nr:hypothetical protein DSO57_1000062 [Entomophthora muscae]
MGSTSRTLGFATGLVFSSGFIYALKRNVHKDIASQQERLKDVEYQLQTAFLPEAKQAEIKDTRPLYREVHERPYILDLARSNKEHVKEVLVPQMKK